MQDFLVTVKGEYLYYGIVRYFEVPELLEGVIDMAEDYLNLPGTFDANHYDSIFYDGTGRLQVFGKYMAFYNSKTGENEGYVEIEKFWQAAYLQKGNNSYVASTALAKDITLRRKFSGIIISVVPLMERVSPKNGDRIIFARRKIVQNQGNFKLVTSIKGFYYDSSNESIINSLDYYKSDDDGKYRSDQTIDNLYRESPFFGNAVIFEDSKEEDLLSVFDYNLGTFYKNIIANKYLRPGDSTPSDLHAHEINYIESIVLLLQHLFQIESFKSQLILYNFRFLFEKFFQIFNHPIGQNTDVISAEEYYSTFNHEYFQLFYIRLREFYLLTKGQTELFSEEYRLLGRLFGLFDKDILKHLEFEKKKDLLRLMLSDNWWVSGRWNPFLSDNQLTEEEIIVKIIQSIRVVRNGALNYGEINDFMDLLNKQPFYEPTASSQTLFEVLYNKVDDAVFFGDDGNGAKGQMIKAIYSLWSDSKYNLNNSLLPEEQLINPNYTSYHALWKYDDPDESQKNVDTTAKPFVINYESEKTLLWYNDNFAFPFYNNQIMAAREVDMSGWEIVVQTVKNLIPLPFISKNIDYTKYVPFGFYNIFDAVAIRHTNADDTIIKIPLSVASLDNPCGNTSNPSVNTIQEKNSNVIPIFYLKYVDDLANYSNFKEVFGVAIDVVLTFTGIGNISKIRYLTKASVIRRFLNPALRQGLSQSERILILRTIKQVAFASTEVVLGVVSIIHAMTTDSCQDYYDPCNPPQEGTLEYEQFLDCQAMQAWLLAFEIMTMSGDLLAKRYFKKKSFELRQRISAQQIAEFPIHLFDDEITIAKADANDFLNKLADVSQELNAFINSLPTNLRDKVNGLSEYKRNAFMFDFEKRLDDIAELVADPSLVDEWAEILHLSTQRKKVKFLKNYKRVKSETDLNIHIFEGDLNPPASMSLSDVKNAETPKKPLTYVENGYPDVIKYESTGIHSFHPPIPDYIMIDEVVSGPNSLGYYKAFVRKKPGGDWVNPTLSATDPLRHWAKRKKTTCFPDSWTPQKIQEEIAYAMTNMVQNTIKKNVNEFKGKMSDGVTLVIQINKNTGSMIGAFPQVKF